MKHFSSSATNSHSWGTLKDIYKSIVSKYLKARGPYVNIIIPCLLGKQLWHSTLTFDLVCTKSHLLNCSSMCIECGKYNSTKVEVDEHIIFHTMDKQSSCEQRGKAFTQKCFFCSIQQLLLSKSHKCQYYEKNHKKPSSQNACSKGSQHVQKKRVKVLTS